MEKKRFRVGVIGCGRISPMHLLSLKNIEDVQLVSVCDIDFPKAVAAGKTYETKPYSSYEEMIEQEHLDAVHLCLPHDLHIPTSLFALSHGVNVLSEKPIAIHAEDALPAISLAKEKGLQYGVSFQTRFEPSVQLVKRRLEEGKLGRILGVSSILTWSRSDEYYRDSSWKGTWAHEGGGVLIDQAIHSLDLCRYLIGSKPVSVSASAHVRGHEQIEVEDVAEGLFTFEDGTRYSFYAMNYFPDDEPIRLTLICEKGKAFLSYDDAEIIYSDGSEEQSHQKKDHLFLSGAGKDYWGLCHYDLIKNFYRALAGVEKLAVPAEDALITQKMVDGVYRSAKLDRPVEIL